MKASKLFILIIPFLFCIESLQAIPTQQYLRRKINSLQQQANHFDKLTLPAKKKLVLRTLEIYRTIYKTDCLQRKRYGFEWHTIKVKKGNNIPVVLFEEKQQLQKVFHTLCQKLHKALPSANKNPSHLAWFNNVTNYLSNIKNEPHIYDHYYSPVHHKVRQLFVTHKLPLQFREERILQEIDLIKENIQTILSGNEFRSLLKPDLFRLVRKYYESRSKKTINDPIPEYRWYGPNTKNIPYDKIKDQQLSLYYQEKRLAHLKRMLETTLEYEGPGKSISSMLKNL